MRKNIGFRSWFYFRQGWTTYFAFIFAAINTMVVTYYLAIENISFLKEVFPTFFWYLLVVSTVGIPILVVVGYIHYKRTAAFSSEADINAEAHPYNYKIQPGFRREVLFPSIITIINLFCFLTSKPCDNHSHQIQPW